MTVTVTPEAEPVPEGWRTQSPLALAPGQTGRAAFDGQTRFVHCVGVDAYVVTIGRERPPGSPAGAGLLDRYHALWEEWHRAPFDLQPERWPAALPSIIARLPQVCGCQSHLHAWLRENPPDYSSRDAFFAYTWRMHDSISARLGKSFRPSLEEARALYG